MYFYLIQFLINGLSTVLDNFNVKTIPVEELLYI